MTTRRRIAASRWAPPPPRRCLPECGQRSYRPTDGSRRVLWCSVFSREPHRDIGSRVTNGGQREHGRELVRQGHMGYQWWDPLPRLMRGSVHVGGVMAVRSAVSRGLWGWGWKAFFLFNLFIIIFLRLSGTEGESSRINWRGASPYLRTQQ